MCPYFFFPIRTYCLMMASSLQDDSFDAAVAVGAVAEVLKLHKSVVEVDHHPAAVLKHLFAIHVTCEETAL